MLNIKDDNYRYKSMNMWNRQAHTHAHMHTFVRFDHQMIPHA